MNSKEPAEGELPDGSQQPGPDQGEQDPTGPDPTGSDLTGPDFEPPAQPSAPASSEPEGAEPTLVLPDQSVAAAPPPVADGEPDRASSRGNPIGRAFTAIFEFIGLMFAPAESAPSDGSDRGPGSRVFKIVFVCVVAALILLFVGDRIANSAAERSLSRTLQNEMSTTTKPTVDIDGFPFLTQFLTGSFSQVHLVADDATVTLDGQSVKLKHVDVTVHDVKASNRYSQIVAGSGEATAVVDWSSVSALAGQQLSYADNGKIKLDFSVPISQLSLQGSITGRPELDVAAQTVAVVEPEVNVASVAVPQSIVDTVANAVLRPIPIPELPYNIEVTELTSQTDGLLLAGNATNIPIVGQ